MIFYQLNSNLLNANQIMLKQDHVFLCVVFYINFWRVYLKLRNILQNLVDKFLALFFVANKDLKIMVSFLHFIKLIFLLINLMIIVVVLDLFIAYLIAI